MKKLRLIPAILLSLTVFMTACKDEQNVQTALVRAFLIDAPGDYQSVFIDVQDIQFHAEADSTDSTSGGWQSLEGFEPSVYDLIELSNGSVAFLGEMEFEDYIGQVRLVLGDSNSVVVDSMSYELTIPSGSESGLKIIVNEKLEAGMTYDLILDFDAARSVKETGNGTYKLRPVIKTHFEANSGAISGTIAPTSVDAVVYAIDANNDTNSTYPNAEGDFMFYSLDSGNYTVNAVSDSLGTSNSETATVVVGETTSIGTLAF